MSSTKPQIYDGVWSMQQQKIDHIKEHLAATIQSSCRADRDVDAKFYFYPADTYDIS